MKALCLLLVLAVLAGCATTKPQPKAPSTKAAATPTVNLDAPTLGDMHDSPLARAVRGEDPFPDKSEEVMWTCLATGEFNLAPGTDELLLDTWCVGNQGGVPTAAHMKDTPAKAGAIPFRDAYLTVDSSQTPPIVTLHHRDRDDNKVDLVLKPHSSESYAYDFSDLVPDVILPKGWMLSTSEVNAKLYQNTDQLQERTVCTPNGLFTVQHGQVVLTQVCLRKIYAPGQPTGRSLWDGDPISLQPEQGRYALPFKQAVLIPQGQHFRLEATLLSGQRVTQMLRPDADGTYSFEDVINRLEELD